MQQFLFPLVFIISSMPSFGLANPIAEVVCAPKDRLEQKLRVQFGNSPMAMGVRSPSEIMEIWTSDAGDWTLVITYASGRSCIVAMGESWQSYDQKKPV